MNNHNYVKGLCEVLGAIYLFMNTWAALAYNVLFGTLSLISVLCGAFIGLHGVWRLMGYPKCRLCSRIWRAPPGGPSGV